MLGTRDANEVRLPLPRVFLEPAAPGSGKLRAMIVLGVVYAVASCSSSTSPNGPTAVRSTS